MRWALLESLTKRSVTEPNITCRDGSYAMAVGEPEVRDVCIRRIISFKRECDAPETGGRVVEGW